MTIREYFQHYYHIVCQGDLAQLDGLFHTDSPFLIAIKNQYELLRKQVTMRVDIELLELLAKQDDLIVVRDKIMVEGANGNNVHRNHSGNLHVLTKRADGEWKFLSSLCIDAVTP
ncbi:hypothetical protein [Alteromonas sp. C1M14]|uniref:hypothetical protein n=1 Tax=Alteromonas sp. C1M14 TaxID=2841567 RepID=UPI001C09CE12|nr:hypothetical protein [Alteromonas sp. C1M14]MBU2977518.1 hypothetical protein [Alteromonas sp. C1M14]